MPRWNRRFLSTICATWSGRASPAGLRSCTPTELRSRMRARSFSTTCTTSRTIPCFWISASSSRRCASCCWGRAAVAPRECVATAARYADRASLWTAVAIGFAIPVSTALDSLLVAALLLSWIDGGRYREKLAAIRGNEFAIVSCALFLLSVAGSAYSVGTASDVQHALGKASRLLLIPVLISLHPERQYRERALQAFKAAVVLTLVLSFL